MNNQSDQPSEPPKADPYDRLRRWYLARLRKLALTSSGSDLTPATLVRRDRDALEKLINERADAPPLAKPAPGVEPISPWPAAVCTGMLVANLAVLCWLFFSASCPAHLKPFMGGAIALLLAASSTAAVFLSRAFFKTASTLSAVTQRERAIADYAMDPFWSLDGQYQFTALSSAGERLLGYSAMELLGSSLVSLISQDEQEAVSKSFSTAKDSLFPSKIETRIRKKDQSFCDVELTIEYSASESSYFCVISDISERKEVDRLKQQLMAMLSHDLKTPLTGLRFSLALLSTGKYGTLTEEGQRYLRLGESNVNRLINLITQLLDLHKLDARKLELELGDTNVSDLIDEALKAIESNADEKNIDVQVKAEELFVKADKDRLLQVLINLLSNAIKYSPPDTEVMVTAKKLPGDWLVELRVTDCGPGISKEDQRHVFDRFYRVQSPDAEQVEGTGLGLAISKAIVEAHAGKIDVDSEPGKGASFWMHIPHAVAK